MACLRRIILALTLAVLGGPAWGAPLEAYGKLPSIEEAALSASGNQVAVIVTNGEERRIVVKDIGTDKIVLVGALGNTKVRDVRWAGERHLIITSSATTRPLDVIARTAEYYFASDLDLTTKRVRPLLNEVADSMNNTLGLPVVRMVGGQPVVFLEGIHFLTNTGTLSLFRADLDHGPARLVEDGDVNTEGFVVGPDGQTLAREIYDDRSGKWTLKVKGTSGWREAATIDEPIDKPDVLGLGRDGRSVLVSSTWDEGAGWREIGVNGESGKVMPLLDGQTPIHDRTTGRLVGYHSLVGDVARYNFFDPTDQKIWDAAAAAFAGARADFVGWSDDRNRILVRVDSPTDGPAYAIVDIAKRKASWLGGEYEALSSADIAPVRAISFKAADGFSLTGYLTLPRGGEAKGLPLIVFPHGGPADRDELGFDWWAQAMASRGYAVLQVNFRGSEGFGWDYLAAGFGQWGRKMQSDLSDGVRFLAGQGTVDPKRVCIVGGSFGGYAALAGATMESGVYRCAVSYGGISDLKRMIGYDKTRGGDWAMRYMTRFVGAKDLGDPVLARYSPAAHAAEASAPILLIHGKDDTVVPLDQSTEMADALRRVGKPVELVVQNNADHWLSLGATRLQMLQATMAFVEKYNPPNSGKE